MPPEKLKEFTDPNVAGGTGADRISHVAFAVSQAFKRRGGKAVDLHEDYQLASATSSNLAGFAEVEELTTTANQKLPVNFGLQKTSVFPVKSGQSAVDANIGKDYDISVTSTIQEINLAAVTKKILTVAEIITTNGSWVRCSVPTGKRYGNL